MLQGYSILDLQFPIFDNFFNSPAALNNVSIGACAAHITAYQNIDCTKGIVYSGTSSNHILRIDGAKTATVHPNMAQTVIPIFALISNKVLFLSISPRE